MKEITIEDVKAAQRMGDPAEASRVGRAYSYQEKMKAYWIRQAEYKTEIAERVAEIRASIPQVEITLPSQLMFVSVSLNWAKWAGNAVEVLGRGYWIDDLSYIRPRIIVIPDFSSWEEGDIFGVNPETKPADFAAYLSELRETIEAEINGAIQWNNSDSQWMLEIAESCVAELNRLVRLMEKYD